MAPKPVDTFFGGSPGRVLVRLALISILIGFVLAVFDLDPLQLFNSVILGAQRLARYVTFLSVDSLMTLGRYLAFGAVIVVPIWLVSRLLALYGRR